MCHYHWSSNFVNVTKIVVFGRLKIKRSNTVLFELNQGIWIYDWNFPKIIDPFIS